MAVAAGHVGVDDQGVEDGFFNRLDDSVVETVDAAPGEHFHRADLLWGFGWRREATIKYALVCRREGEEDIAREVAACRAGAAQANWYAAG